MSLSRPQSHTLFSWPDTVSVSVPASHTPYSWGSEGGSGIGVSASSDSDRRCVGTVSSRLDRLEQAAREVKLVDCSDRGLWETCPPTADWCSRDVARVITDVRRRQLMASVVAHVPSDYYNRSLMERSVLLHTSPQFLCKCVLLENKAYKPALASHPSPCVSSRFLCVVLQYVSKLDMGMLVSRLCALSDPPLAMSSFEFLLAAPADSLRLSGFQFNAVTPFGMAVPTVPMVVSASAAALPYVWLGGGDVDVKLRLSTGQLVSTLNAEVFDCAVLRSADDDE